MRNNMMRRLMAAVVVAAVFASVNARADALGEFLSPLVEKGVVLIRQDYQLVDPDNDRIYNMDDLDYYGRTYSLGVRLVDNRYMVSTEVVKPWEKDLGGNEKFVPRISRTAYRGVKALDYEPLSYDEAESEELLQDRIFAIPGSEEAGFEIDTQYGNKNGFILWLCAESPLVNGSDLSKLNVSITKLDIRTREDLYLYDVSRQPDDSVVGGVFLTPRSDEMGKVSFRVNGMLQKVGGVWKLVSFGTDMPDDEY